MHNTATKPSSGWMESGAATRPARPVKTTSDITRGLARATKSRQSAGNAASPLLWRESAPDWSAAPSLPVMSARLAITLADTRQRFELVIRRRAGQCPLQSGRAFAPGIVARLAACGQRAEQEIGRAHVRNPVTNAQLVCRLLLT